MMSPAAARYLCGCRWRCRGVIYLCSCWPFSTTELALTRCSYHKQPAKWCRYTTKLRYTMVAGTEHSHSCFHAWINHFDQKRQQEPDAAPLVCVQLTHIDGVQNLHCCLAPVLFVGHSVDFAIGSFSNGLHYVPVTRGVAQVLHADHSGFVRIQSIQGRPGQSRECRVKKIKICCHQREEGN